MSPDAPIWLAAGAAGLAGLAGTIAVRAFARRMGAVSTPNPLVPQHTRTVAYLGGVGVAIGIAVGIGVLLLLGGQPSRHALGPALGFLALGVVDDLVVLRPAVKFGLQGVLAALAVMVGVRASLAGVPSVDAAASWLWIVTLVNAFNVTDVCDGLLGSLAIVAFAALAWFDPAQAGIALVVAGACLGFLPLNAAPASIFLGDAGSHLLGFLAAASTLEAMGRASVQPWLALAACALLIAVPLFEMVFLIVVRVRKRRAWWRGSPDHFSLRLQAAGLSRGQTVWVACGVAALWAAAGLTLVRLTDTRASMLLAIAVLATAAGAAAYLWRHEVTPRTNVVAPAADAG